MSKIKYVNSTGLGSLVKYADTFKTTGGGMALIKVPAKVKIVIEMLGLNAFFDICPDLDAALSALKNASGAPAEAAPAPSSAPPRVSDSGASAAPPRVGSSSATQAAPRAAPSGAAGFPVLVTCEGCTVQVEIAAAGNWKCPRCYTPISVQGNGSHSFGRSDQPVPLNLSLTASQDCGEGLVHLVTSVCTQAFNGNKLEDLRIAVHEVAQVMQQSVYSGNPNGIYHISIERQRGRVQIRFSDNGATIESARASQFFPHSSAKLSEFECRPHPAGGNTIRIVQTG
jgi:hypothetical protein